LPQAWRARFRWRGGATDIEAPQTGNGYDPKRVTAIVEDIEELGEEIARIQEQAASKIGEVRQRIGQKLKEAKKAWAIPTRPLKALLKERKLQRKIDEIKADLKADLEDDDQESLDQIREALGGLADFSPRWTGPCCTGGPPRDVPDRISPHPQGDRASHDVPDRAGRR
jgi:hypothetical protein